MPPAAPVTTDQALVARAPIGASSLDRPSDEATDQEFARHRTKDGDRHDGHDRIGAESAPIRAAVRNEAARNDRKRARLPRDEDQREKELAPCDDRDQDRGRADSGQQLWKDNPHQRAELGAAVELSRLFKLDRDRISRNPKIIQIPKGRLYATLAMITEA